MAERVGTAAVRIEARLTWDAAEQYCVDVIGGHLPAVTSAERHEELADLCFSSVTLASGGETSLWNDFDCWIGLSDPGDACDGEEDTGCSLEWISGGGGGGYDPGEYNVNSIYGGTSVTISNSSENCFAFEGHYHNGRVEGGQCTDAKYFLCEGAFIGTADDTAESVYSDVHCDGRTEFYTTLGEACCEGAESPELTTCSPLSSPDVTAPDCLAACLDVCESTNSCYGFDTIVSEDQEVTACYSQTDWPTVDSYDASCGDCYVYVGESVGCDDLFVDEEYIATAPPTGSFAEPDAPTLVNALMSESGTFIKVNFDKQGSASSMLINGSSSASGTCDSVFDAPTNALLGAEATCQWASPFVLIVYLGPSSTLTLLWDGAADTGECPAGSSLQLAEGGVRSSADSEYSSTGCVPIDPPDSLPFPVAAVFSSDRIGLCDDLVLDASASTGSGGRQMQLQWSLLNVASAAADEAVVAQNVVGVTELVERANSGLGTEQLVVPAASLLSDASYTFELMATNFFGNFDSIQASVEVSGLPVPTISIVGGSQRSLKRSDTLILRAEGSAPACAGEDSGRKITFEWFSLVEPSFDAIDLDANLNPGLYGNDARNLNLYPYSLGLPGSRYKFKVVGTMEADSSVNNSATVELLVTQNVIVGHLAGGTERILGENEAVALDTTASVDLDEASPGELENEVPLAYIWSCSPTGLIGACLDSNGTEVDTSQFKNSTLVIPAGVLPANGSYMFTVRIGRGQVDASEVYMQYREANVSTVIHVVAGSPPVVSVQPLSIVRKYSVSEKIIIFGSASEDSTLAWSEETGSIDTSAQHWGSFFATEQGRSNLVVRAGALVIGTRYEFRLTATNAQGSGHASVSVLPNAPPTSGHICVMPESGRVLSTLFTLSASQWTDDVEDLPLYYSFLYSHGVLDLSTAEEGISYQLSDQFKLSASLPDTLLPQGREVDDYTLTTLVHVADNLGATQKSSLGIDGSVSTVRVTPIDMTIDGAADVLVANGTAALSSALDDNDPSAVFRVVSAYGSALNTYLEGDAANSADQTEEQQSLRETMLDFVAEASELVDVSDNALRQQAESLAVATAVPQQLTVDSANKAVDLVASTAASATTIASGLSSDTGQALALTVGSVLTTGGSPANNEQRKIAEALSNTVQTTVSAVSSALLVGTIAGEEAILLSTPSLDIATKKEEAEFLRELTAGATAVSFPGGAIDTAVDQRRRRTTTGGRSLTSDAGEVEATVVSYSGESNPHGWSTASNSLHADVTTVEVSVGGAQVGGEDLPLDLPLTVRFPLSGVNDPAQATCRFWDGGYNPNRLGDEAWLSAGLSISGITSRVDDEGGIEYFLACDTIHLSDFAAEEEGFTVSANTVNFIEDTMLLANYNFDNMLPVLVIGGIFVLFSALAYRAYGHEHRSDAWLSNIRKFQYLVHGKVGAHYSGQTLDEAEEAEERVRGGFCSRYWFHVRDKHDYAAMFDPTINHHLVVKPHQQCLIVLCSIMCDFAVNAIFYGKQNDAPEKKVAVSLISAACMLPASNLLPLLFHVCNNPNQSFTRRKMSARNAGVWRRAWNFLKRAMEKVAPALDKCFAKVQLAIMRRKYGHSQIYMEDSDDEFDGEDNDERDDDTTSAEATNEVVEFEPDEEERAVQPRKSNAAAFGLSMGPLNSEHRNDAEEEVDIFAVHSVKIGMELPRLKLQPPTLECLLGKEEEEDEEEEEEEEKKKKNKEKKKDGVDNDDEEEEGGAGSDSDADEDEDGEKGDGGDGSGAEEGEGEPAVDNVAHHIIVSAKSASFYHKLVMFLTLITLGGAGFVLFMCNSVATASNQPQFGTHLRSAIFYGGIVSVVWSLLRGQGCTARSKRILRLSFVLDLSFSMAIFAFLVVNGAMWLDYSTVQQQVGLQVPWVEDQRGAWVEMARNANSGDQEAYDELLGIQDVGSCCGFDGPQHYPINNCSLSNFTADAAEVGLPGCEAEAIKHAISGSWIIVAAIAGVMILHYLCWSRVAGLLHRMRAECLAHELVVALPGHLPDGREASPDSDILKTIIEIQKHVRGFEARQKGTRLREYEVWQDISSGQRALLTMTYISAGCVTLFMLFLNLIFGIKFDEPTASAWIETSSAAVVVDVIVMQPLLLVLFQMVKPSVSKSVSEMFDF